MTETTRRLITKADARGAEIINLQAELRASEAAITSLTRDYYAAKAELEEALIMKRYYFPNTQIKTSEHGYAYDLEITTGVTVYARHDSGQLLKCDSVKMPNTIGIEGPDGAQFNLNHKKYDGKPGWVLLCENGEEIPVAGAA